MERQHKKALFLGRMMREWRKGGRWDIWTEVWWKADRIVNMCLEFG